MKQLSLCAALLAAICVARDASADDTPPRDPTSPAPETRSAPTTTRPPAPIDTAAPDVDPEVRNSDAPREGEQRKERTGATAALGAAAAVIPGVVVHGAGHLATGETRTGLKLLALEGAGLGLAAAGFLPIVFTGASRRVIGPAAALSVAGVGLFAISLFADMYGVLAPQGGTGTPFLVAPDVQTSFGYRYVYDPVFAYRHFLVQDIDYRTGGWRIHPSAWFALDDTNALLRAHVAYRFIGPRPGGYPRVADGSFLDLDAAVTRHAFTSNRFTTTTGELAISGRLDMVRFDPLLRGSFAEMSFGMAMQAYSYKVQGTTADLSEILLARFGFGMYFGRPGTQRGEALVYYDHRHDGYAAGLKIPGLGSGVAGHFGAEGRYYLSDHWGLAAEAVAGSAYVMGLSVLFRQGAPL
ncbi:MAG: hypothetical protein ABW133_12220 [Polyangiaceae bacterium]